MFESTFDRRRKRIVEHIISGFATAAEAVRFGNTMEALVNDGIGYTKFRLQIGSPDTKLAITKDWKGATVLKTIFLNIEDQNKAQAILEAIKTLLHNYNKLGDFDRSTIKIESAFIRGKPQPQTVGFEKPVPVKLSKGARQ